MHVHGILTRKERQDVIHAGLVDVVLAGGIHVHGVGPFRDGFCEAVRARVPGARFTVLDAPPVAGAALLALEAAGEPTDGVGPRLAEELRHRVGS